MSVSSPLSWRRVGLLLAVLSLFVGVGYVTQIDGKTETVEKFEWTASQSAAKAYPIELVRADLALADGSSYYVPDKRAVYNGWGQLGATHIVGDDEKSLPTHLDALWFSYIEGKFYEGRFELPTEEIQRYFSAGFESPRRGEKRVFDTILFGFGPEGEGSIWMSGHGNVIKVSRFKGDETDADWKNVVDNPDITREAFTQLILSEAMTPAGAEQALKNGYEEGSWPRRQQRLDWSFKIEAVDEITLIKLDTLNGEKLNFFEDLSPVIARSGHGIPGRIQFQWIGNNGEKRAATIIFDAEESLEAFEKLAGQSDGDLQLNLKVSSSSNGLAVILQTTKLEYEFEKATIEIFSM